MITGKYPYLRLRRSRKYDWSRRLIEENSLSPNDFILPIFLIEGKNKKQKIIFSKFLDPVRPYGSDAEIVFSTF